ncbi:MAG: flavodoxin-dependent (E)-4-hydroxy-3-methylbut-2-enyl-diphosphate synthase [Planctomycetota bacterium]|jgi:(E)-4-hydroxy-3-methylbut-2-enyl-diphosphate synthase
MEIARRKTRPVQAGRLTIGGDAPVSVQTMGKASPDDVEGLLRQTEEAAELGCGLIRLAIPNRKAIAPFAEVVKRSPIPVAADIHFNAGLALESIKAGADKIRINPGNMRDWEQLEAVIKAAGNAGCALRIGVNSGSIKQRDDDRPLPVAMTEELLHYVERIEGLGFTNFVMSLKAPDAATTLAANLEVAPKTDYPLHIGVTHAGPEEDAMLKSAIGVGGLLAMGIGDTIRISFTGTPASEIIAGKNILRAAGRLHDRAEVISCPTCGRCKVELMTMVEQVKARLTEIDQPITVAVMGCEVNGPGEAKEADIGIAAGKGKYALFRRGELLRTVPEKTTLDELVAEIQSLLKQP